MMSGKFLMHVVLLLLPLFAGDNLISERMDPKRRYNYLALGDSYSIGEAVPADRNFPNQLVQLLKLQGHDFAAPRIIAKTGWTTDELENGMAVSGSEEPFAEKYDLITLLIGVNNQYRGRTVENYRQEFEKLLKKAISYAGNRPDHVVVLSIPDWGVTPFAEGRDRKKIAQEIDAYNAVNREITLANKAQYVDITGWTREAVNDSELLTSDGLHPSAKEYKRWAEKIALLVDSMY